MVYNSTGNSIGGDIARS